MGEIQKVALLGVSLRRIKQRSFRLTLLQKGLLGSAVLDQLVKASFTVTVFTRNRNSVKDLPSGVSVAEVDYHSYDSLLHALQGQDAVVSTVNNEAVLDQKQMIDAAISAGVKRFIPADFGALSTDPKGQSLPVHHSMVQIQQYLADKARSSSLEYTVFATGGFLDLLLTWPFVLDFPNRSIQLYGDGTTPFSTTSVASIGKAVAGALKNPAATKNRVVRIHDIILTQAKMLEVAKKFTPGEKWTETVGDAQADLQKHLDDIKAGEVTMEKMVGVLKAAVYGGMYKAWYENVDNELLGLGFLSDEEFEKMAAASYLK
ncbi:MAG: hypothetical protein Q9160_006240 [Pyrenula sp. 1 TL-2023]